MHQALIQKAYKWFEQHKIKAFYALAEEATGGWEAAALALMRMSGLGKLRPNMMLMGYKADWKSCSKEELENYFNLIQ
jgi:solute carrier family 12 sodium/potassium/chloride transporter 2